MGTKLCTKQTGASSSKRCRERYLECIKDRENSDSRRIHRHGRAFHRKHAHSTCSQELGSRHVRCTPELGRTIDAARRSAKRSWSSGRLRDRICGKRLKAILPGLYRPWSDTAMHLGST